MTVDGASDYLIIGSGIAGLRAAVSLAPHGRTVVLTKAGASAGSTGYAQGGIAAAIGPDDSPDLHAADTMAAGDGLCHAAAVRVLVDEGPAYVRQLIEWGAAFDRAPDGTLDLAREGAHAVRRVLHARDATGREIARTLAARLQREERDAVAVRDHAVVVQLVTEDGAVVGARYLDADGILHEARARATLIATGGAGQAYRETTNPTVATGDGVTLAWLAGARVADLEFVQFHPTALAVPGQPRYLLSEALRGEGARLVSADGQPFMSRYDPMGDLAPRDRVARAIVTEAERTGAPVCLSLRHLPEALVHERFPHVASLCRRAGLDLARDLLPVGPAAHYLMGGITTDQDGRTSLPGLFAAGEAACTGVHGANRLASNSLLEGLVFGGRAGEAMRRWRGGAWPDATPARRAVPPGAGLGASAMSGLSGPPGLDEGALRDLMWRAVGVFRDAAGLTAAVDRLDAGWSAIERHLDAGGALDPVTWRRLSLGVVGRLIARAALRREESRGGHSRTDFPERDDLHWNRHATDVRA
ncbi:MAG: L-aspartate oxidase [Vicinamibacterales bacterium]